jgi:excinuclease ABC subunit B
VSLVAILDADQEGFLRSDRSLIQTIGRAARHMNGMAILYADRITGSMQRAIDETDRRRAIQHEHNLAHGITPHGVQKSVDEVRFITRVADARVEKSVPEPAATRKIGGEAAPRSREDLTALVGELEIAMREAAMALDFEAAARLRDQLFEVRTALGDKPSQARGADAALKRPPGSSSHHPGVAAADKPPLRRAGGRRGR